LQKQTGEKMARIKKDRPLTQDKRFTSELDLLRTAVWLDRVQQASDCKTPYAVAMCIEGHADNKKKWQRYLKGEGVPNQATLDLVDDKLPDTSIVFLRGPANLPLWSVLESHDADELKMIASQSNDVDGRIAQFKLDLQQGNVCICPPRMNNDCSHDNDGNETDEYVKYTTDIQTELGQLMPSPHVEQIMLRYFAPIRQQLDIEYEAENYEFAMSGKYTEEEVAAQIKTADDEYHYALLHIPAAVRKSAPARLAP